MTMRILIITQSSSPEMGALASRMAPIVRRLTAEGHQVFVSTGMPNYPRGEVFAAYRSRRFLREESEGYTILRTAYFTTPRNRSKWLQLFSYLSFIPAALHSGLRAGRVDLVFVTSPPIFPAVAGALLAKLRRAKLVFDARDLWPDELITYGGAAEGSVAVRAIRAIERWIYREADRVTGTTQSILDAVIERGVAREKAVFLPNGADLELFRRLPADNPI